jgi:anaphase-promoting complex subunit 4
VLELLKENLIPAVDRCTIILSNLQGLAQYHEHSPAFDVPVLSFSILLEITKCIRLISHHILLMCSQEFQSFAAFSKWLRWIIEVKSTDPRSAAGEELMERDPGVDYPLVLSYIEDAMVDTDIDHFIGNPSTESSLKADLNMYETLRELLKNFTQGKRTDGDIMDLSSFYTECQSHNRLLIEQVTSWQRKNTIIPGTLNLPSLGASCCDIRMVSEDLVQSDSISSYVVVVSSSNMSKGETTYREYSTSIDMDSSNPAPNRSSRAVRRFNEKRHLI